MATDPREASTPSRRVALQDAVLAFLHRLGEAVGGFVLLAVYLLVLGPVAVVVRAVSDPLHRRVRTSGFVARDRQDGGLRDAMRQG